MQIRAATPDDAAAISALVQSHSPLSVDMPGAEAFLASISCHAMQQRLADPAYQFSLMEQDGTLLGMIAMQQQRRIAFFFVAHGWQGQGIGRTLWHYARAQAQAAGNDGEFVVNSDLNAIGIYQRLGFVICGEQVAPNGVAYVPMRLAMPSATIEADSAKPSIVAHAGHRQ